MRALLVCLFSALVSFSGGTLAAETDELWWNEAWSFRAPAPQDLAPVLNDVCAVKADFTALLTTAARTAENLFDTNSIRVIGAGADGKTEPTLSRFLPNPDFNSLSRARGTLIWKGAKARRYWIYFDSAEHGVKPSGAPAGDLSINLLPNGGFDQGQGDYRTYGGGAGLDTNVGRAAKNSIRLFCVDKKGDYTGVETPKIPAEGGKTYGFELHGGGSRGQNGPTGLFAYMDYADAEGKYLGRAVLGSLEFDGAFHWDVLKGALTLPATPAGIRKIGIHAGTSVGNSAPIWLDDFAITPDVGAVLDQVQARGSAVMVAGSTPNMDRYEVRGADSAAPEAPPDREEKKLGFQIWASHPAQPVFEYTKAPADRQRALELAGTPGEILSGTFCVRPFAKVGAASVEIAGAALKPIVEVRQVRFLAKQATGNSYVVLPECLEAPPTRPPARGVTAHYFLTVRVPKDARAGTYAGSVRFSAGGRRCSLPIALRVYPFTLDKPEGMVHAMTYAVCWWNEVFAQIYKTNPVEVFNPEQQSKYFRDMVEHNVNGIHYSEGFLPACTKTDKGYTFDFSRLHPTWQGRYMGMTLPQVFSDATRAGIELITIPIPETPYYQPYFPGTPFSEEWNDAMVALLESSAACVRSNGWPQRVLYTLIDEPANSRELTDATINLGKLVREKTPGLRSAVTLHKPVLAQIGPCTDVCIMQVGSVDEEVIRTLERMGKEFWVYNGGSFGDSYLRDRLFAGFYAYRTGAKGVVQFAYMWPKGPDAYDDFKGDRGAGIFYAYPSPEGPSDTVGLEGWRDGVNDYRYLYTLRKAVDAALAGADETRRRAAQAAWDETATVLATFPLDGVGAPQARLTKEGAKVLDVWRSAIAERIIQLQAVRQ